MTKQAPLLNSSTFQKKGRDLPPYWGPLAGWKTIGARTTLELEKYATGDELTRRRVTNGNASTRPSWSVPNELAMLLPGANQQKMGRPAPIPSLSPSETASHAGTWSSVLAAPLPSTTMSTRAFRSPPPGSCTRALRRGRSQTPSDWPPVPSTRPP
ncbi:unnamed protein product [Ectocarpus sp. 12 AP-2014]